MKIGGIEVTKEEFAEIANSPDAFVRWVEKVFSSLDILEQDEIVRQYTDAKGNTLLHEISNPQMVECLIERYNCPVNKKNAAGVTPLEKAFKEDNTDLAEQLFRYGAKFPDPKTANRLMFEVINRDKLKKLELLLKNGASPNAIDAGGTSALSAAIYLANLSAVKQLIKAGAKIDQMSAFGQSYLMEAIELGSLEIVQELINAGADLNFVDVAGRTALDYAKSESPEMVALIQSALDKAPKPKSFSPVEAMLDAKAAKPESKFKAAGKKQSGVSAGYVAKDLEVSKLNMIKIAEKVPSQVAVKSAYLGREVKQELDDHKDLVTEYATAPLFKIVLKDQAPDIALVTRGQELDKKNPRKKRIAADASQKGVAIRSKFFTDFKTLSEFTGASPSQIKPDARLVRLQGIEKIIAACLLLGEIDWHPGNIGVRTLHDENGQPVYIAAKIDHGRSLQILNIASVAELGDNKMFKSYQNAGVKINVSKLAEAIEDMQKLSQEEIKNMLLKQLHDLKNAGMPLVEINKRYQLKHDATIEELVDEMCVRIEVNRANSASLADEIKRDPHAAAQVLGGIAPQADIDTKAKRNKDYFAKQKEAALNAELTQRAQHVVPERLDVLHDVMPKGFEILESTKKDLIRLRVNAADIDVLNLLRNKLKPEVLAHLEEKNGVALLTFKCDAAAYKKITPAFLKQLAIKEKLALEESKLEIPKIIAKWGAATTMSKFTGDAVKLGATSQDMQDIMNFCSELLKKDESKKMLIDALIQGLQKQMLSRKGLEAALRELDAPAKLKYSIFAKAKTSVIRGL